MKSLAKTGLTLSVKPQRLTRSMSILKMNILNPKSRRKVLTNTAKGKCYEGALLLNT